ncbi:unnamed protein product [Merluccius merluccius]
MFLWMNTEEMALGELLERLRIVGKSIEQARTRVHQDVRFKPKTLGPMSLHDFLRDGGEAPHRIMNRLSQLIQNLDITGLAPTFPFSPSSRKNSWRDWDGKMHPQRMLGN